MTRPEPKATSQARVNAGPWVIQPEVYGAVCQICGHSIFSLKDAYCRKGDDLSPTIYRHGQCHKDAK